MSKDDVVVEDLGSFSIDVRVDLTGSEELVVDRQCRWGDRNHQRVHRRPVSFPPALPLEPFGTFRCPSA